MEYKSWKHNKENKIIGGIYMILVQAHRGASAYAPENTLPAFSLAVKMNADGVENDIHLTKDNRFVVCHDDEIARTSTGKGLISQSDYNTLVQYDFGVKYNPSFEGTKIPLLEQFLDVVKDMKVINIELKGPFTPSNKSEAFKMLYDIIKSYGCIGKSIISSFEHILLKELKEECPNLRTALLYGHVMTPSETVSFVQNHNADFIHPALSCLKKETVDECRKKGIGCNIWTVNAPEHIKVAIEMEPTGIITDVPDRVLKALGR